MDNSLHFMTIRRESGVSVREMIRRWSKSEGGAVHQGREGGRRVTEDDDTADADAVGSDVE